jgi:hypothetical protein
MKNRGWR